MKTKSIKSTSSLITRRSALGLVLAGATLPVTNSFAPSTGGTISVYWHVINRPTTLTTCSGESIIIPLFESELLVRSGGAVRGFMRFTRDFDVLEYVAEVGGLDLDRAGEPIRSWVLLRLRGSSGKVAQDFMLTSVAPAPLLPVECLIYTTVGTDVHAEPVRFEVPGRWEVRR